MALCGCSSSGGATCIIGRNISDDLNIERLRSDQ